MTLSPGERSAINRRSAQVRWAKETPTRAKGQHAHAGLLASFRRKAEEYAASKGEQLSDAELDRRARSLRDAYMNELALKSVRSRRAKAAARAQNGAQSGAP
jgi:hypothetical protein